MNNIRIKLANFEFLENNRFNIFIDKITGYGYIEPSVQQLQSSTNVQIFNNNLLFLGGQILNPIGFQPAIFFKTGLLTGNITGAAGSFTWNNINLQGTGAPNSVYLNYITGYQQAKNTLEFIDNTGSGLINGDFININSVSFVYNNLKNPTNFLEFDSPQNLINILNSGAAGAFNNIGLSILQNVIGITGYLNNNKLELFSFRRSGEDGNTIRVYRDCENLNAIKVYSRYFTGGQSFRPLLNSWIGNFSNNFSEITVENSGVYTRFELFEGVSQNISGIAWVDNFSGNYFINTGIRNINNLSAFSPSLVPFINNKYFGTGFIPSGQFFATTGLNIDIIKPNPYNISGNLAKYIFSGDGFLFSGLIEG